MRNKKNINSGLLFSLPVVLIALFTVGNTVAAEQEYDIEVIMIEDMSGRYLASENWPVIPEETNVVNKAGPDSKLALNEKRVRYLSSDSFKLKDDVKRIQESKEYKVLLHTAWRQTGLDKTAAFPVHVTSGSDNVSGSYIEGDFTFVMSRYLHIAGDFTFYKATTGGYVPYPVSFNRRMRSRETHYLDHPMVGVVVLTTPISR
jgi:hypothetical protein